MWIQGQLALSTINMNGLEKQWNIVILTLEESRHTFTREK